MLLNILSTTSINILSNIFSINILSTTRKSSINLCLSSLHLLSSLRSNTPLQPFPFQNTYFVQFYISIANYIYQLYQFHILMLIPLLSTAKNSRNLTDFQSENPKVKLKVNLKAVQIQEIGPNTSWAGNRGGRLIVMFIRENNDVFPSGMQA